MQDQLTQKEVANRSLHIFTIWILFLYSTPSTNQVPTLHHIFCKCTYKTNVQSFVSLLSFDAVSSPIPALCTHFWLSPFSGLMSVCKTICLPIIQFSPKIVIGKKVSIHIQMDP